MTMNVDENREATTKAAIKQRTRDHHKLLEHKNKHLILFLKALPTTEEGIMLGATLMIGKTQTLPDIYINGHSLPIWRELVRRTNPPKPT